MVYLKRCKSDRHSFESSHVNFIKVKKKTSVPAEKFIAVVYVFLFAYMVWVENWFFYTTKVCRGDLHFMWELHPEAFRKQVCGPSLPLWWWMLGAARCWVPPTPTNAQGTPLAISSSASSWEADINWIHFSYMVGRFCVCILITCGSTDDFSKYLKSCKESNISGFSTLITV